MRLLIYAMESSGASTFCYFLGQRRESIAVIDVWSEFLAPSIRVQYPIVAKVTANLAFRPEDHITSFRPDATILFIRDPLSVYCSLIEKPYAHLLGIAEQKLAKFDRIFVESEFDLIVEYEKFANGKLEFGKVTELGWPCGPENYKLARSVEEIVEFNCEQSPWLREHFRNGWGPGNYKAGPIASFLARPDISAPVVEKIKRVAPNLSRHYHLL
jgi:hypothetical protein